VVLIETALQHAAPPPGPSSSLAAETALQHVQHAAPPPGLIIPGGGDPSVLPSGREPPPRRDIYPASAEQYRPAAFVVSDPPTQRF